MPRPRQKKHITTYPYVTYYKPQGVPLKDLSRVTITHEEWEALRLKHKKNYNQIEAAHHMHISQSTFQRILSSAHKKIGNAIVHGRAIQITT